MKTIVTTPERTTLVGTAETVIRVMMDSRMDRTYRSTEDYMEQVRRDAWRLFGRTICTDSPMAFLRSLSDNKMITLKEVA